MAILGVGTDIIEIERVKKAIERTGGSMIDRLFTEKEKAYCNTFNDPYPSFAARFAGKEAVLKALGCGMRDEISWLDIEISHDPLGKPIVTLSKPLRKKFNDPQIEISLSHSKGMAIAFAVAC